MSTCEICGNVVLVEELVDTLASAPFPRKFCGTASDGVYRFYHELCALNALVENKKLRDENKELKEKEGTIRIPDGWVLCRQEDYWSILPNKEFSGHSWKDNCEMGDGCLSMIYQDLVSMGTNMYATPPMFYNDAIRATVARHRREAVEEYKKSLEDKGLSNE